MMTPTRTIPALRALALALCLAGPAAAQAASAPSEAPAAEAEPTMMLKLRDGRILWGSIAAHDPERLRFRRLANGGTVELGWSFLDPSQGEELRTRFGYVDVVAEEVMITADRLLLDDGSELVGRIVNRTDDAIWLKTAERTVPVPKRRVTGASTTVRVPALDVFTKEELYQNEVFQLQDRLELPGRAGAEAHLELARFAERLFDYTHAAEHYRLAAKLDPTFEPGIVAGAIARSEAKAALQDQVDLLSEIDLLRARKQYPKALEKLATFPKLYPESPLLDDWNDLRARVARYQERDLREAVVGRWHYWSVALARKAAREKESYEAALAWLEDGMGEELVQHVQEDLQAIAPGISPDDVRKLWEEREGGRYHQASYGYGTWLLGDERARAELEAEAEAEEAEEGSQSDARKELEERVKRYLENQELARRALSGGGADATAGLEQPEDFWKRWTSASKAQWILAYYVENSGDFRLQRVRFANCRECGGTGARQVLYTGSAITGSESGERLVPCPTCHHVGVLRRVRYR
jgi:hypothetical protein